MLNCTGKCVAALAGGTHPVAGICCAALERDLQYWRSMIVSSVASQELIRTGLLSVNAQLASAAASGGGTAGVALSVTPAEAQAAGESLFRFAQRGTAFVQASHVSDPAERRALGSAVARRLVADFAALGSGGRAVWGDGAPPLPCSPKQLAALLGAQEEAGKVPGGQ